MKLSLQRFTKNDVSRHVAPVLFSIMLAFALIGGVVHLRSFMMEQMVNERSAQLEELIGQIRLNLRYGIAAHWNVVSGLDEALHRKHYANSQELLDIIGDLEGKFRLDLYSSRIMLLESTGTVYTRDGDMGIWDDIKFVAGGNSRYIFVTDTSNVKGTYLAFAQKLEQPIVTDSDRVITHLILLKDIASVKKYYDTESFGGHAATYIIQKNGTLAYYDADEDDVIGVRNIYKALGEYEYVRGRNFAQVRESLAENGIATANIMLNGTEYYYCLTRMKDYDLTVMMLIPAEYVAISTRSMMESTFQAQMAFTILLLLLLVLAVVSVVKVKRSSQLVKVEQEANHELNRLRIAAEDALHVAEAANKSKSVFLSNMSHDIRTPMNAVIGFATLALTNLEQQDKVKDYLSKILSASNHLLSLINDILDMSRIESGKIQLDEMEANLSDMLHDIKDIIGGQVQAKSLELYMDVIDVADEDVYCDRTRLNQVLLNLLSNAIKFTPPGGTVSVRIAQLHGAAEGKGMYEIRVKDNGIGMSQEFAAKIFEPFERERTSTVSKIQGTGLGMAITKNIIDMMGGTIEVITEQDKGTEFVIRLEMRLRSAKKTSFRIQELEGLKALVVDDDFNTCDSVTKMLVKVGMRSEWTMFGKEAVLRARQSIELDDAFHVYILDWRLPDLNGVEVARQIRALGDDTPIIIMTAYDWNDIEDEARAAGVTAFCAKPMFMSDLRDSLLTALGQQREKQQAADVMARGSQVSYEGKRLLLAEDNEMNREIACEILGDYGLLVETAENGAKAVEMVAKSQPGYYDMVLMDIQMPVLNGHEATVRIRQLPDKALACIPIVAMTANAFDEDRKEAEKHGMNGFISKPINMKEVMEALSSFLR